MRQLLPFSGIEDERRNFCQGCLVLQLYRQNWSSNIMGKALILWLCGVPGVVIALLFFTGMLR